MTHAAPLAIVLKDTPNFPLAGRCAIAGSFDSIDEQLTRLESEQSGFEDLPRIDTCRDPGHNPPNMMVVPYGQRYRHVCPSCGRTSYLYGSQVTLCAGRSTHPVIEAGEVDARAVVGGAV